MEKNQNTIATRDFWWSIWASLASHVLAMDVDDDDRKVPTTSVNSDSLEIAGQLPSIFRHEATVIVENLASARVGDYFGCNLCHILNPDRPDLPEKEHLIAGALRSYQVFHGFPVVIPQTGDMPPHFVRRARQNPVPCQARTPSEWSPCSSEFTNSIVMSNPLPQPSPYQFELETGSESCSGRNRFGASPSRKPFGLGWINFSLSNQ